MKLLIHIYVGRTNTIIIHEPLTLLKLQITIFYKWFTQENFILQFE